MTVLEVYEGKYENHKKRTRQTKCFIKKRIYPKTIKNLGHHCFVPDVFITFSVVRYYKKGNSNLYFLFSRARSEEHTSELQSRFDLVCRLLLENKKIIQIHI